MTTQALTTSTDLDQLIQNIFLTRKITRQDQRLIMSLQLKNQLTAQEHSYINQIHQALFQGRIRVFG
ncbi:MAG: hypothetical protein ACTS2F_23485 [Thainema sp.]